MKTLKVVLSEVLNDYEGFLVELKNKNKGFYSYCLNNKIHHGICYYLFKNDSLNYDLHFNSLYDLFKPFLNHGFYITDIIEFLPLNNKRLYSHSLEVRIEVLKSIIENLGDE